MSYRIPLLLALMTGAAARLPSQTPELRFDRITAEALEPYVEQILASAADSLEALLAAPGPRTVANTLRPYDDLKIAVNRARVVSFIRTVHPDAAVRAAAARAEARLQAFNQARRANRRIYAMLQAVDTTGADAEAQLWRRRELDRYRRELDGRSDSVRARVTMLERELNRLGRRWDENPRHDTITVAFRRSELAGMAADWLAARETRGPDSLLVSNVDFRAVSQQAASSATREQALRLVMRPRPNHAVLDTMLRLRHELATLTGERTWATRQLRTTMAGSPEGVRAFLDQVRQAAAPMVRRLVERRVPRGAAEVALHDLMYRPADSAAVPGTAGALRAYLPYPLVRDGMLALARELLGLDFRPAADLPVWDLGVEAFRVYDGDRHLANAYFDLYWKPGRSAMDASAIRFRVGVRDRVIGEVAIRGGLARARPGEPPTLGPRAMETMFHEFGHLLHAVVAIRPWFATSGLPEEYDFREVPSTLFEAWARDPAVIARFARHFRTGALPPPELLAQVNERSATQVLGAQWLARMSLELHDRAPGDLHAVAWKALDGSMPPGIPLRVSRPEGDVHPELMTPHLGNGYDAAYYTYIWSSVISQDLLTRFDRGLLDPAAARAYRVHLLDPGGSQPAAEMVRNFLGRPFSLDAWARALPPE